MTMDEIAKIKACSRGANSANHPWHTWTDEMMKKTALKRLFKYVPISIEVSTAIAVDEVENTVDFFSDSMLDVSSSGQSADIPETSTEALINEIQEAA
jgi:recombination protein RecT